MSKPRQAPQTVQGDIVVTSVAGRYTIGRVTANGKTQSILEVRSSRAAALRQACAVAGDDHRVILVHGTRSESMLVDCAELGTYADRSQDDKFTR